MEINKVQWRMIAKGAKLPCDSFLMKKDGTMTSMVTGAGVTVGQDAYYLPVEELRSFPKEENYDERMIQYFKDLAPFDKADELYEKYGFSHKDAIAWLEKQGEQNATELSNICEYSLETWIKIVDFVLTEHNGIGNYLDSYETKDTAEKLREKYKFDAASEEWDRVYRKGLDAGVNKGKAIALKEQKPIDKVEPKFKVGDWVIDKQGIVHQISNVIENVTNHTYCYDIVGGGYFNDNTEGVRLWTIQDAKDGDVLYTSSTASNEVFIFKELTIEGYIECYCSYDSEDKYREGEYHFIGKPTFMTHPATKEQRDQLEKAMADAGYEWDAEKKELLKIEQKNVIDIPFGAKDSELQEASYHIPEGFHAEIEGSNVIIKKGEQNPAWSEEDEKRLQSCLNTLQAKGIMEVTETINTKWLKSLKDRLK